MTATHEDGMAGLLKNAEKIATLPDIFFRINNAVEDPESSFAEIGRIISSDPALSARLLKIVNSPFYGFESQVETITHAITIIGTAQLRDLVLATTVMDQFNGISTKVIDMKKFWLHSIACGLGAKVIATFLQQRNPDRFYMLGVLHDLGRLVMLVSVPEKIEIAIKRSREEERSLIEVEKEVVGFDHSEIGAALMEMWKLPPAFCAAVQESHLIESTAENRVDAAILHLADIIAHSLEWGSSGDPHVPPLQEWAWDVLSLSHGMVRQFVNQLDRQMQHAAPMFL